MVLAISTYGVDHSTETNYVVSALYRKQDLNDKPAKLRFGATVEI